MTNTTSTDCFTSRNGGRQRFHKIDAFAARLARRYNRAARTERRAIIATEAIPAPEPRHEYLTGT